MPCGPCGPVHLGHMLEKPWHGHSDAALLVAPTLGPHVAPAASSMRSSVESPIKTPIGLSTFLRRSARESCLVTSQAKAKMIRSPRSDPGHRSSTTSRPAECAM
jgi:hypothetical protein